MNGYRAYQQYLALKKHFNEQKYSVIEKPRVEIPEAIFLKRNERYLWEKLAERKGSLELMVFMLCNFIYGHENFIFDMEKAEENYTKWMKDSQSIGHLYEVELERIQRNCNDRSKLFEFQGATAPILLQMYLGGYVSIHTMVLLNSHLNFVEDWKGSMSFLFEAEIRRIEKSRVFIKFHKDKFKKVTESFLDDL